MSAWYIRDRAEMFTVLAEARARVARRRPATDWPVLAAIDAQLAAIERWTAGGRTPTVAERESLTMGWLAVRELDPQEGDDEARLVDCLVQLAGYVAEWPEDPRAVRGAARA